MHRNRLAILCTLTLVVLLSSACSLPERTLPGVTLFMSSPIDGSVLAVGPVGVLAAASISSTSPFSAESLGDFTFWANGVRFATVPSGGGSRQAVSATWTPTEPGEYLLQASAKVGSQTATSATIRVCVVEAPAGGLPSGIWGYTGPCDTAGLHSEFSEPGPISMWVHGSPSNLYFNPTEGTSCELVRLDFWAGVTDAPDQVYELIISYSIEDASGAGRSAGTLFLDHFGGTFPVKDYYGVTGDLDQFIRDAGVTGPSEIEWTARAFGYDWALLLTDGPHTIPVFPCTTTSAAPTATPVAISQRCEQFQGIPIELVTLDWTAGAPLTFYFKMPGGVPGLENLTTSTGNEPWLYSVDWGGISTEQCRAISGYPERLYCGIVLPASFANTVRPLELHLSGCEAPIYTDLRADVPGFGSASSGGPKPGGSCQPPIQGCGPNSAWYGEPFCMCGPY